LVPTASFSIPEIGMSQRTFTSNAKETGKLWLKPVRYERSSGFTRKEILTLERLVAEHQEELLRSWDDYISI
jgi:hypothetical protein